MFSSAAAFLFYPLLACLALAGGVLAGWLWWGRALAVARTEARLLEARLAERQARFEAALADIKTEQDRALAAEARLDDSRSALAAAREQLAGLVAAGAERERGHQAQLAQIEALRAELDSLLKASAAQALAQSQEAFLALANESFARHRSSADAQLAQLVQPVSEQLKRAEEQIGALEKHRAEAYGALTSQIHGMREDQEKVRHEAQRLTQALRGSAKARGNWGERQLRNVLEMAGLSAYTDFETEKHVATGDGAQRPDAVVRLPGGRMLVIDAKTSLNAYQAASQADSDSLRQARLAEHCGALKDHADQLGRKRYWDQFEQAPDFVVMFVPGEHFLHAALDVDPDLWEFAFKRRILIATPVSLIALARTVSMVWRQETMAETARETATLARDLYKRLCALGDHVQRLGRAIAASVSQYNTFVGSLETSVLPQARKFNELGVDDGGKALPSLEPLDTAVREPVNRDLKTDRPALRSIE